MKYPRLGKRLSILSKSTMLIGLLILSFQTRAEFAVVYTAYDLGCGSPCTSGGGCCYRYQPPSCLDCDPSPPRFGSGEKAEYAWIPDPADP